MHVAMHVGQVFFFNNTNILLPLLLIQLATTLYIQFLTGYQERKHKRNSSIMIQSIIRQITKVS